VERLWFATPVGHSSLGSGQVVRRVANRLHRYFDDNKSPQKSPHRVYISRAKAAFRRIVNENEISPALEEHGFEKVLCEDLSLADQVTLFAKATAIIGGHGAGLTNIIYCPPESFVGEIHIEGVPPAYLVMARQLGMRFSRFKANALEIGRSQVDIHVNAGAFGKWVCDSQ
jgi:capsular polysaccharide biosynthesis protein